MTGSTAAAGGACAAGQCTGKCGKALKDGAFTDNPVCVQILGICSALAVTTRLENALVMGAALIFTTGMSNLLVSLLRNATPRRVRMIAEVTIIATFVILFDQFLKAFYPQMSGQLGPYVGLIITNCIVMGRAEAYAMHNPPLPSIVDGLANGIGYAAVLAVIGIVRELAGTGRLLGFTVLPPAVYTPNQAMVLAPGAFVVLGCVLAAYSLLKGPAKQEQQA